MRYITLFFLALMLMACGGSKTVRTSKKVIKGDWQLNNISYSQAGIYNVTLLNDAPKACFENSTWNFIPNNNTGTYILSGPDCNVDQRYFVFTIDEVNEDTGLYDFLIKPTDRKNKSETNNGFRLQLTSLSETNMQWQQTVSVDGSPFTITMNFIKQ